MCGICGLYTELMPDEAPGILSKMNEALSHRGPDDAGEYCHRACYMGMRRLSIIDVAGGHQPIFNEEGQIGIVYNGEIYNYQDLQKTLKDRGHRFQTPLRHRNNCSPV